MNRAEDNLGDIRRRRCASRTIGWVAEPAWVSAYLAGLAETNTSSSTRCFHTSANVPTWWFAMMGTVPGLEIRSQRPDTNHRDL